MPVSNPALPTILTMPHHPHLIREVGVVTERTYTLEVAARIEREVEAKAFATAARLGVKRPVVRMKGWDLDGLGPLEYPMFLLGPDAPRLRTAADCLAYASAARYQVLLDDQDYLDTL